MVSEDWLFEVTTISREIANSWYIFMFSLMIIAVILAYKFKLTRFSALLWLVAGAIGLIWESALFMTGVRTYTFSPVIELLYHALTEAGPGLIIMVIFAWKIGIIDISEFQDDKLKSNELKEDDRK
jgi:hypothetical protein